MASRGWEWTLYRNFQKKRCKLSTLRDDSLKVPCRPNESFIYRNVTCEFFNCSVRHHGFHVTYLFCRQVAENLLPQSQCETFVELIEDIVKQLRLDPTRSLPLVAHGPPDQSAGGSPVTSRRPRDRDHSLDTSKVHFYIPFCLWTIARIPTHRTYWIQIVHTFCLLTIGCHEFKVS